MSLTLELARFIGICCVMGYAAYSDHKTGEVPNKLWLYVLFGVSLTILETILYFNMAIFIYEILIMGACLLVGFLSFGIGAGGADAKAIMTIGFSAPLFPIWGYFPMPLPLFALFIGSTLAIPFIIFKKSKEPLNKRKIRFLPFLFFGLLICVVL